MQKKRNAFWLQMILYKECLSQFYTSFRVGEVNRKASDLSQPAPTSSNCMEGQVCRQHYIVLLNLTWCMQIKMPKDLFMTLQFYLFLYWYNMAEPTEKFSIISLPCSYSNFVLSHPKQRILALLVTSVLS